MKNIKIVEFGSYLAAPLACKYLADSGFDVTCVKKPENDETSVETEYMKHTYHDIRRNKRVVEIDLKKDMNMAHDLIRNCNVVVENMKRGSMKRLGIGFEDCKRINPDILYVSIPGYNSNDDEYSLLKPWDSVVMASSGVFFNMGLNRTLLGIESSFSALHLPSTYASIFAAFAISSALFQGKKGEYIEVSMASALSEALVHNSIDFPLDDSYQNLRQLKIKAGEYPINKEELLKLTDPFFSTYMCSDDRPIYIVCPSHKNHQTNALKCLGIYEKVLEIIPKHIHHYSEFSNEHGIGSGRLSENHVSIVRPIIQAAFLKKTASEWECILGNSQVPCIAHKSTMEWKHNSHTRESGLFLNNHLSPLVWHRHIGVSTNDFSKQTFEDVKVLDMSNVIAGPTIGTMLARMGCTVTKLDPVKPFYGPCITVLYGIVVNIGKESILVDINTVKGRQLFEEILKTYDILIVNNTSASLERLGFTTAYFEKINPNLIVIHFDAWSGYLERGNYKNFIGYDDNVQAGIGIMERFGGSINDVEEHAHIGTIDVIAGVSGALSAVVSLIKRKFEGLITVGRTSLAATGQYLQYLYMFDKIYPSIGRGVSCRGFHCLHKCYETSNGCIMLVATISNVEEEVQKKNMLNCLEIVI